MMMMNPNSHCLFFSPNISTPKKQLIINITTPKHALRLPSFIRCVNDENAPPPENPKTEVKLTFIGYSVAINRVRDDAPPHGWWWTLRLGVPEPMIIMLAVGAFVWIMWNVVRRLVLKA